MDTIRLILPELILAGTACALFLIGTSSRATARRAAPWLALLALLAVCVVQLQHVPRPLTESDLFNSFRISPLTHYVRLLTAAVSVMFVLLFWPTNPDATGNGALQFGQDAGEFFALLLLAVAGVFLVAGADDIILLFLGIELASIPTYIMVSISRPQSVAQEAGVKYFFLGAMSAALMLFGFSYLYGTTGTTSLRAITQLFEATTTRTNPIVSLTPWQMLAVLMLIAGFCFKIAAVPMHVYAADVYQGAATPVTAMLSFIPKTSGMVALIKLLYVTGGGSFGLPESISKLLWVLAVLTMSVGNVLGLLQFNVKRVLAYSSIAHSGYMLVGLAALAGAWRGGGTSGYVEDIQQQALAGVLFYLAAYGVMNAAAFGVLMLLPARDDDANSGAETFKDIAGRGRTHLALGLAMAVSCFSLIGLPLTVGFFGKLYLITPAFRGGNYWLVIITLVNAAISAAYYLNIVGTMFLRTDPSEPTTPSAARAPHRAGSMPIAAAVTLSVVATLLLGTILPATQLLSNAVNSAARVDDPILLRGETSTSVRAP